MSPLTQAAVLAHWQKLPSEPFELDRPPESFGIIPNPEDHEKLGDGNWGEVYVSQDPITDNSWAVKCCFYDPKRELPFGPVEREYRILKMLRGAPHTVLVEGICRSARKIELAMGRFQGFDLADWLIEKGGRCSFKSLKTIATKTLTALAAYHERGVVHGDIKLENCMFNPQTEELEIIDFGAAYLPKEEDFQGGGTLDSMAPELLLLVLDPERFEKVSTPDHAIDLWALGAMLFALYVQSAMFNGENLTVQDMLALIANQFRNPFLEYTGTLELAQKYDCSPNEIKQIFPLEEIQKAGLLPPLREDLPPSCKISWEARIKRQASNKGESKYANQIIALIANMLVCDPSKRITAQQGLDLLSHLSKDPSLVPHHAENLRQEPPALEMKRSESQEEVL